jgi:hypothetical protein
LLTFVKGFLKLGEGSIFFSQEGIITAGVIKVPL